MRATFFHVTRIGLQVRTSVRETDRTKIVRPLFTPSILRPSGVPRGEAQWRRKCRLIGGKLLFLVMTAIIAAGSESAGAQSATSVYAQECAACHGPKGKSDGPAGQVMAPPPPPFSTTLKGKSDGWIESVIAQGGPPGRTVAGDAGASQPER